MALTSAHEGRQGSTSAGRRQSGRLALGAGGVVADLLGVAGRLRLLLVAFVADDGGLGDGRVLVVRIAQIVVLVAFVRHGTLLGLS